MVVMPFAFLLSKSGILFLLLSITALPSLPSKLALKLTFSNSILTYNSFSAEQIWNSLLHFITALLALAIKLVFAPMSISAMCVCEWACASALYWCVCVCVCVCMILCACVFAMLYMKMFVKLKGTLLWRLNFSGG